MNPGIRQGGSAGDSKQRKLRGDSRGDRARDDCRLRQDDCGMTRDDFTCSIILGDETPTFPRFLDSKKCPFPFFSWFL